MVLVERPTSAQVMISWLVSSSPALGSMLTAQSLEPGAVSASLSAPPLLTLCLGLKNKQMLKKTFLKTMMTKENYYK